MRRQVRSKLLEGARKQMWAFSMEVQLESHLERVGLLLSQLVTGYNHTKNSAGWTTIQGWA